MRGLVPVFCFTICFLAGCNSAITQPATIQSSKQSTGTPKAEPSYQSFSEAIAVTNEPAPTPSPETEIEYPGVFIDSKFPLTETDEFTYQNYKLISSPQERKFSATFPVKITRDGKTIYKFKPKYEYSRTNGAGVAALLGEKSQQLYYVNITGGPCCVHYWIIDVTSGSPKEIFRSDDYNDLSEMIELHDFDNDGTLEISQLVYTFRYFDDLCGSCSPLVHAVFKYDKAKGKYLPARGLYLPYAREYIKQREEQVAEENKNESANGFYWQYKVKILEVLLGHIYAGEREKGWKFFEKNYLAGDKKEYRPKIEKVLAESKLYKALYRR